MATSLSPDVVNQIRNSPAAEPPDGVIPTFTNPPNLSRECTAVIIAGMVITTLAALIRFYTRVFCVKRVRLEDYIGLLSFGFFLAASGVSLLIARRVGFFVHQWDVRVKDLEVFLHLYVASTVLNCATIASVKAAILMEWSHIFVAIQRNTFYWICYGMLVANVSLYSATIGVVLNACQPRERIWRRYLPGTCVDINAFNIIIASVHLSYDLLMLLLPHTVIWRLKLSVKYKIGVSVVFSVGALACVWATGRIISSALLGTSRDKTHAYSEYLMWNMGEVVTAELVFCVPAIPLLFKPPSIVHEFYGLVKSKAKAHLPMAKPSLSSLFSETPPHPKPEAVHIYHNWVNDDNHADLGLGGRIKVQGGRIKDQSRRLGSHMYNNIGLRAGRILVTTDIYIRSHRRRNYDVPGSNLGFGEPPSKEM